jgi:hypothetical protein
VFHFVGEETEGKKKKKKGSEDQASQEGRAEQRERDKCRQPSVEQPSWRLPLHGRHAEL